MKTLTFIVGEDQGAMLAELRRRFETSRGFSSTASWHLADPAQDADQMDWDHLDRCVLLHPWATLHQRQQVLSLKRFLEYVSPSATREVVILTCHDALVNAVGEDVGCGTLGFFNREGYCPAGERWEALVVLVRETGVIEHRYDERGVLGDGWPVGFFCP